MMTATISGHRAADAPRRPTPGPATRFVDVRANLMPPEILASRQTDKLRRRVLIGLAAAVAVAIAGYGASWLQTVSARSDLSDLHSRTSALAQQQLQYAPLARTQEQVQAAKTQLGTLMTGDIDWSSMLAKLRSAASSDIAFTNIATKNTATTAGGAQVNTATGVDPINPTQKTIAGTLTIAGNAARGTSVAAYSDALGKIPGITSVLVTSVSTGQTANGTSTSGVAFTITASVTSDALGGRFTTTTPTGTATAVKGGK